MQLFNLGNKCILQEFALTFQYGASQLQAAEKSVKLKIEINMKKITHMAINGKDTMCHMS